MNAARAVVSCIVPVHNGAAFIGEAIESILAQTGPDLDVIVVDDGSTDNSAEIAEGFAGVRVHRRPQGGVASARNDGLALARGDYIAFLDADDLWLPGKLAAQMTLLEASPRADYCLTLVRHVITAAGELAEGIVLPGRGEPALGRLTQCLVARRRAFGIVGGFDTGTTTRADQDWFMRAESRLASVLVNEVFTIRRIHGDNHSLRNAQQVRDDFLRIAKRNLDRKRRTGAGVDAAKPRTP